MKCKLSLINPVCFCDKVTHSADKGKAVNIVCLDFGNAFDTVSHTILLEKLAVCGLDGCTGLKIIWMSQVSGSEWS